ncbi:phosphate transporter family protein [Sodiomyces alkalinus F11]|uniref:Phosphate transporter n=1 Tax=Sodiomyces alkalinus (strain CBS 110278 / VKM F-3762 / F11) TaxID=1314773 RepID=A0A3N2PS45_SODAK|nr:phosphate transporter family protein [Sodiomyces alkalinus F11]ROT37339.1 phosphate transporter family protein [Sodiomyces alkalinus F11]
MSPALPQYWWILAITTVAFCLSAFGNGANDVANAFATSVAARTLTMAQAGVISVLAEFLGAVVLGSRVTNTIKNGIIGLDRFRSHPATILVAMGAAEIASATWLLTATKLGFPVSTTHTIVGALIGAGIGAQSAVTWQWTRGSVSQIAASWLISPLISAAISAILFATLKFSVLERKDSFQKALRAIPFYLAFTGAVLALFITIEAPGAPSLEELGAGIASAIVLGTFFGVLAISYIFFLPYFHRVVVLKDPRMRPWHLPLGPLLRRENPPLYFPGKETMLVDHYQSAHDKPTPVADQQPAAKPTEGPKQIDSEDPASGDLERQPTPDVPRAPRKPEPEERFLAPTAHLPMYHPKRIKSYVVYFLLQGVTRDCITHSSLRLENVHSKAPRYDNRIEHLWTYAQVASAVMMSISHGSNDVANAVGPWVAVYQTYNTGEVGSENPTPVWILAVAGILLGAGFWFMGHHIVKALGNKITQLSPTRGYAMELGAAITILLASRLGLPVSTTQTLTGAVVGVSLMNMDFGATNWKQLAYIFLGWVLTLPCVATFAGLLTAMALNAPSFS